jgi:2-succinyl-5-enolpyruvyl-6-hydroxy-3-cyclohexene-1-carboxylate synthase
MALARHPAIQCIVVPDERSAAYIAMGIAQSTRNPVVLTCTSGTAALNYAPAIAEAYYQQVPLIVLTADRPPEWIDQNDGQAIRQKDLYRNHTRYSNTLPLFDGHADTLRHSHRMVSEAIAVSKRAPGGPVHINVPVREPFYPVDKEPLRCSKDITVIVDTPAEQIMPSDTWQTLEKTLAGNKKILLVAGQNQGDPLLGEAVREVSTLWKIPVITEHISNLPNFAGRISHHDEILSADGAYNLAPDIVISFGKSILSKKLKTLLRSHAALQHWHVGHELPAPDPFGALSRVVPMRPLRFFQAMAASKGFIGQTAYLRRWTSGEEWAERNMQIFFPVKDFGEYEAVKMVLEGIPRDAVLHLANSMPVRYAQALCAHIPENVPVYSNRGTSGIDGCSSTMVGHALANDALHVLLTGDMAFLYDRNAFWHNQVPSNIRIIVLNNGGGGIFRLIPGPDRQPELETFLETKQKQNAANTAADFGFTYYHCTTRKGLSSVLRDFYSASTGPTLLEITSPGKTNQKVWRSFVEHVKKAKI